jgi:hypothetical protein
MFKKRPSIEIKPGKEEIIYPSLDGNDDLPDDQKFGVVIRRLSNMERISALQIENGHVKDDAELFFRASIKELINPPLVNGERDLTVDDIMGADELYQVFQELYIAVMKLNAAKMDKKK